MFNSKRAVFTISRKKTETFKIFHESKFHILIFTKSNERNQRSNIMRNQKNLIFVIKIYT